MKPSLTALTLALSSGGSAECGTESEALPEPRDACSATLLRADLAFTFSLSITVSRIAAVERESSVLGHESVSWEKMVALVSLQLPGLVAIPGITNWQGSAMTSQANALTKKV